MKIFSGVKNKTIDRSDAIGLAALNQFATPGLGTILAGRWTAGLIQLAFAGAGFALIMLWFLSLFRGLLNSTDFGPAWEWQIGALLFAIGWVASLWSSVDIVRKASAKTP